MPTRLLSLKGIEYFLADVAVQNLKQVVDVVVLIRHLKCVHERCELSGCTGGYTGEIQTAELTLLDSGALVAKLAGEVALDGDAAVGLFLYRVSETLAGLRSDVLCVMAVCQAEHHSIARCRRAVVSRCIAVRCCAAAAAGAQCKHHGQGEKHRNNFLQGSSFLLKKALNFLRHFNGSL